MNGVGKSKRLIYAQCVGAWVSAANRDPPGHGANAWLALIAVGALAAGSLVYVFDPPAATVYLLPNALSFGFGDHPLFGAFGGHLPELVHVYAFILLTVAVSPWPERVWPTCAFWWLVDSLFELGQHPLLAPHLAAALPEWFQHVPILDHTANYFLRGTFDLLDLFAIAFGTLSAYFTIGVFRPKEVGHVHDA